MLPIYRSSLYTADVTGVYTGWCVKGALLAGGPQGLGLLLRNMQKVTKREVYERESLSTPCIRASSHPFHCLGQKEPPKVLSRLFLS